MDFFENRQNCRFATLKQKLDTPVEQIFCITVYCQRLGMPFHKIAKTDSLNPARNITPDTMIDTHCA